jgi:hypothetical protein
MRVLALPTIRFKETNHTFNGRSCSFKDRLP